MEKLKVAAASPATHPIALAVSGCLDHEDSSVQLAALQTLSWMGPFAAPHAGHIAKLLQHESKEFAWQQLNHCPGWKKWVEPMLVKSYTFFFQPLSEAAKRIQEMSFEF